MTETGTYKRYLGYKVKGDEVIFEISRTKKLKVGWGECEYKEVGRMKESSWNALRDNQKDYLEELRKEHLQVNHK
jgi:hypothetical protein